MQNKNKKTLLISLIDLIAGINKHYATGSLTLASKTYTGPELVAVLQPLADLLSASAASRAAWLKDVHDEEQAFAQAHELLVSLNQALYASYGNAADTLADFGLPPRTRRAPSAAVKAAAAAKARATREARGELGKRQRVKIVAEAGNTPAAAPAAPEAASGAGKQ